MKSEEIIFSEALEKSPAERATYLDTLCGDDAELRQRVEVLLKSHDEAGGFLDEPVTVDLDATLKFSTEEQERLTARTAELRSQPKRAPEQSGTVKKSSGEKLIYFGDYELQSEIARGAMGVVYRAEQKSLKRIVAIKMIRSTLLANDADVARFQSEAEAAASLDHPNIVPIYEIGEHEDQHYFSMKLIEGGTLTDRREEYQKNPRTAVETITAVAHAIHSAHQRGILHRDIKPGNILVDEDGIPYVTDFGLAKQMESNSSMTLSGQIMGTPSYMSPEQADGAGRNLTTAADVYALGAVFYELLTGQPPHRGESLMDTLKLVIEAEPEKPRMIDPNINLDLETIALKCLQKDPKKRYASAQGLANDLESWLRGEPILARPVSTAERAVKWMKRKPVHAAAAGVTLLLLLTLGVGGPIAALRQAKLKESADSSAALADERAGEAEEARGRANAAAKIAEERSEEIRKTLYANEMHLAQAALSQPGGALRVKGLLDNWRPVDGEADLRGWEWYYLRSRLEQSEWNLPHPGPVKAATWSVDGRRVFTGCDDGKIRVWDVAIGRVVAVFEDHSHEIHGLAISPDGGRLASLDADGFLKIRNALTGDVGLERKLAGGSDATELTWSPDGSRLAAADGNKALAVIDSASGETVTRFDESDSIHSIRSADWHPDGKRLAVACGNDLVIRNLASGEAQRFKGSFRASIIMDADWDSEGNVIVSGINCLYLANPVTGEVTFYPSESIHRVERADFLDTNGLVAFVARNRGVYVFDPQSGETLLELKGHAEKVFAVKWSPDGQHLLSAAGDGLRIWHFQTDDPELVFKGNTFSLNWRPGGGELAIGDYRKFTILTPPKFKPVVELKLGDEDVAYEAAWSPDGERIAVATDQRLSVWKRGATSPLWEIEPKRRRGALTNPIGWEPGGERIVVPGRDHLKIYSAKDGTLTRRFEVAGWKRIFAWAPGGKRLAMSGGKNRITLIDVDSGEALEDWPLEWARALAWSPSGDILATARADNHLVELWQMPGAKKIGEFSGGSLDVRSLAWSPDGALLAVGGLDSIVRIWSFRLGRTLLTFHESGPIKHLAWDESGARLAISTWTVPNGTVKMRDAGPGLLAEASPKALPWLDQLIEAESDRVRHRSARAELLEKLARWKPASAEWAKLAELRPDISEFARRSLEATLKNLSPAEAIARLETRLEEGRGDAATAGLLARLLLDEAAGEGWVLLEIDHAVSEGGAILLPQPDGSLLAAGDNPPGDVYRVTGRPGLSRITAVRLETIPDDRLPNGGSGRSLWGVFHLGNFSIERESASFSVAWSDFHYVNSKYPAYSFPIEKAIDADPDSGWDPDPKQRERHMAVFEFAEPLELNSGEELTIRLQTGTRGGEYPMHNLGRFRLSVADHPNPARLAELQHLLAEENTEDLANWVLLGAIRSIRDESEASAEAFGRALEEAKDNANTGTAITEKGKHRNQSALALNFAIRAIAQAQQGNRETSQTNLDEAKRILTTETNHDRDWKIADILRHEAGDLLKKLEK